MYLPIIWNINVYFVLTPRFTRHGKAVYNRGTIMTSSNGTIFRVTRHLRGEFTGPRWIPRSKASDAEL